MGRPPPGQAVNEGPSLRQVQPAPGKRLAGQRPFAISYGLPGNLFQDRILPAPRKTYFPVVFQASREPYFHPLLLLKSQGATCEVLTFFLRARNPTVLTIGPSKKRKPLKKTLKIQKRTLPWHASFEW
jgi:hypothetical protein